MVRFAAFLVLVVAVACILVGRVGHHTPIAIAGYVLLAAALVIGLMSRRA